MSATTNSSLFHLSGGIYWSRGTCSPAMQIVVVALGCSPVDRRAHGDFNWRANFAPRSFFRTARPACTKRVMNPVAIVLALLTPVHCCWSGELAAKPLCAGALRIQQEYSDLPFYLLVLVASSSSFPKACAKNSII
jgi:hypothetical protein